MLLNWSRGSSPASSVVVLMPDPVPCKEPRRWTLVSGFHGWRVTSGPGPMVGEAAVEVQEVVGASRPAPDREAGYGDTFTDKVESDFGGAKSYEWLRDAVAHAFNPPDDDAAEEEICCRAIFDAADYISRQPCECADPDDDPCERCRLLGLRAVSSASKGRELGEP